MQDIQTLQNQLDQQKEQLAQSEATKLEIEAVRDYRQLRRQQQQLEGQVEGLKQQLAQVGVTVTTSCAAVAQQNTTSALEPCLLCPASVAVCRVLLFANMALRLANNTLGANSTAC